MNHETLDSLEDEKTFNDTFNEVEDLLKNLNYTKLNEFREMNIESIDPALFDPASFMKDFLCLKDKNDVIEKCLQWYKEEKEKSKSWFHFIFAELSTL